MTSQTLLGLPRVVPTSPPWRTAWDEALYGARGFYRTQSPTRHFRTSVTASDVFAGAIAELLRRTGITTVYDVGAGRGELLSALRRIDPGLDLFGVDLRPRPEELPVGVHWAPALPDRVEGLVLANEWLDNVPCHVAEVDRRGVLRLLHVDPATGRETPGANLDDPSVAPALAAWVSRWWPADEPGQRVEIGSTRDRALAGVVERVDAGLVLAVDYGHDRTTRPFHGSLRSYQNGRQVSVLPDGSRDVTADVATDSAAAAVGGTVLRQRDALLALGAAGHSDVPPASSAGGPLADLVRRGEVAEVVDPAGLGSFHWVVAAIGIDSPLG